FIFAPGLVQGGGLVKQFIDSGRRNILVAIGDVVPEAEGFLDIGIVLRVLEITGVQEANGMPINNQINVQLVSPNNSFINQLQISLLATLAPGPWMNRQANRVYAPVMLEFFKQTLTPLIVFHQF